LTTWFWSPAPVARDLIFSKKSIQERHAEPGEIFEMFKNIVE